LGEGEDGRATSEIEEEKTFYDRLADVVLPNQGKVTGRAARNGPEIEVNLSQSSRA